MHGGVRGRRLITASYSIFKTEYIDRKEQFVYTQSQKIMGCPEGGESLRLWVPNRGESILVA